MKLPRGASGDRLVRALEHLGYRTVRRKGSHVQMLHPGPPTHTVTVPLHNPLKVGTLHGIVPEVARARLVAVESILERL
jgi:predicted RNA binding protein YcfA (HicA-like mRNA interferase family)